MGHQPLCNLITWQKRTLPGKTRTLQYTSLSFDVSFQEIFSTLCSGGTLVLIPDETRRNSQELLHFLNRRSIERLFMPFVALQELSTIAVELGIFPATLSEVITAGEQLRITPQIRTFFENMPGCRFYNQYGPTESHVATSFALSDALDHWPYLPAIGKPIANTKIYILDAWLHPVPVGIPGELYIGGDCLGQGYFENPELTEERFVPNPFNKESDEKLYKTGDLARFLPDGNIEYLGRLDQQVKIRGFRVEPAEIECVLDNHPAIQQSAVVAQEDSSGNKRLVAYVLMKPNSTIDNDDLRNYLQEKLPDYMIPSMFAKLDQLPLSPNKKIDRKALPHLDQLLIDLTNKYSAPRNQTEKVLVDIWENILDIKNIGIHDNFFDLGGHSLLATRIILRVRKAFQVKLPLRALFQNPTIAEFAEAVARETDLREPDNAK